ncbi:MAG: UDP-glucose--hexose-1-phosphate uridylyltransferase [Acidobacteria bacterium]|nr:UDP-glucose--hexose-1-phosphate uridylyltransferase [Acidobacteriota bacterium]
MRLDGPHRRYNPLLDEWVLVSPQRLGRPWQGQVDDEAGEASVSYDPACYLCPGNVRANGARNPAYAHTFVFDNDFPAIVSETASEAMDEGLLRAVPERGVCRVVCFSPRHDLTLSRMDVADIGRVVDCWADEVATLGESGTIGYVQVFENRGAMMGCSNPHPHGQIWATEHVPGIPARKLDAQRRYFAAHGTDLVGDYLARELAGGERVVCSNEHWVALVPFWAVWPFETMLVPRRRVADLVALADDERQALADIVKRLGARYDNLFRTPFPYSMGWHGAPTDGAWHPYLRLHATYLPPLLRSATVRKFLVGYELTAEPQRDLTAEVAAARLREMSERHYRDHE